VQPQIFEDPVFEGRQLDRSILHADALGPGVEGERSEGEQRVRESHRAPHERPEARQQFLYLEGLDEIIIRACPETLDLVLPAPARGQGQDREAQPGCRHRRITSIPGSLGRPKSTMARSTG
jgi:hypothetical protein